VEVVHGDTAQVQFGIGTFGSRSAAVGGMAAVMSVNKIEEKAKKIAAFLLEAAEADLVFEGGQFFVKGTPGRGITIQQVALAAYVPHKYPTGLEPGLEATSFYDPSNFTWPFGSHVAVVEVDPETGVIKLRRYIAVDDCGRVINPLLVDGQIHGGLAQGIAQALFEEAVYDENGQLISGSLMDYAVPKADDLLNFELDRTETPSPVNALGVKGVGEAGTIASSAAIVNAVVDALAPFGVKHLDMPLKPERVWQAIQQAQAGR
jgi:aerobic carbon-monoxide dehydrogenase large subunit